MSFRLATVNIEGDRHFDRLFPFITEQQPDVLCCQEVFRADMPVLEKQFGMPGIFAPQVRMDIDNPHAATRGEWGVAIFSRLKIVDQKVLYYVGDAENTPVFYDHPDLNDLDTTNNVLNRVAMGVTVETPDKKSATIVTVHFTWSIEGASSPRQLRDAAELKNVLKNFPPHILCGDTNSPRGNKTFEVLSEGYVDALPQSVTSTLDPDLHRAGHKQFTVDALLAHSQYEISDVSVHTGVSDHKAIVATITSK